MNRAVNTLRAQEAWRAGITGKGITVAVLDTGMVMHPDLQGRLIGFYDTLSGRRTPYDDCGHGTHVCGIMGGSGRMSEGWYRGIAPGVSIVEVKVLDRMGKGRRQDMLTAIQWVLDNRERYQIRILNISVGTVREGDYRDKKLVEAVEKAWDAGLVVVVAAGNMGPQPQTITAPGNSRKVITVGSLEESRNLYSSRGPTANCVCKPDIVAPGTNIISCNYHFQRNGESAYCKKSGTSMATPMVSGATALLLQKEPWLTNVEVKMKLREAALNLGLPHARQGWGLLNIPKFLSL